MWLSSWLTALATQLMVMLMGISGYSSRYLNTDHGRLHYFEATGTGTLPPILMVHGIGSQASDLYLVAEKLRPYVRKVISLDLPGHGLSEIPVTSLSLEQFQNNIYQGLDQLLAHEDPVVLFGNSLGGWQAVRYALHKPQELAGLILVSPAGAQLSDAEFARLHQIFAIDSTAHPETLVPLLFNQPPPLEGTFAQLIQGRFGSPDVQALLGRLNRESCLTPEQLGSLSPPTMLIWGAQDRIFPKEELPFFKQYLPKGSQIIEPEHFTHSPYVEAGMESELATMVLEWTRQLMRDPDAYPVAGQL